MTNLAQIIEAPGWWLIHREEEGDPWSRSRLVSWALVDDTAPGGERPLRYVTGLVLDERGEAVIPAPPGAFVHEGRLQACGCQWPMVGEGDEGWCRRCCGLVPE